MKYTTPTKKDIRKTLSLFFIQANKYCIDGEVRIKMSNLMTEIRIHFIAEQPSASVNIFKLCENPK